MAFYFIYLPNLREVKGRQPKLKPLGTVLFKGQTDQEEFMKKYQKNMNRNKKNNQKNLVSCKLKHVWVVRRDRANAGGHYI